MAGDLSTHGRHSALKMFGYITKRRSGGNPSRDVLPLGQGEREQRTPTSGRSNATMARQQKVNDHVALAKSPSNLMQRLSCFPTAPQLCPLHSRKPHPSCLRHKHHL
jgi:hypothetical protein